VIRAVPSSATRSRYHLASRNMGTAVAEGATRSYGAPVCSARASSMSAIWDAPRRHQPTRSRSQRRYPQRHEHEILGAPGATGARAESFVSARLHLRAGQPAQPPHDGVPGLVRRDRLDGRRGFRACVDVGHCTLPLPKPCASSSARSSGVLATMLLSPEVPHAGGTRRLKSPPGAPSKPYLGGSRVRKPSVSHDCRDRDARHHYC
jgi:hypothetical protein